MNIRICFTTIPLLLIAIFPATILAENIRPKLSISLILPLSGEWAFLGEGIVKSAQLAKADLSDDRLNLVFENNKGSLSESALIANRLIAEGSTDAIITIISGVAQVVKPLAEKSRIIQIGICSDTTVPDARFNFINYVTAKEEVSNYVSYFQSMYGKDASVGIYSLNESGFKRIAEEFKNGTKESLLAIKFVETYNQGEHDFKPILLRSLSKKPTAILLLGLSPELETLARQLRVYDKQIPLTSIESFGLVKDKQIFKGSWYVDAGQASSSFINKYEEFANVKITPGVVHAYDSIFILHKAFLNFIRDGDRDLSSNREEFSAELGKIKNFEGQNGEVALDGKGIFHSGITVREVE